MHFMTEDCNISSNKENFAVVVPITSAKFKIIIIIIIIMVIFKCYFSGELIALS